MKLEEIFKSLTSGELSQVELGGGENGAIAEDKYETVLNHINLGLAALFTRFSLKEGLLELTLVPGQRDYWLHSTHSTYSTKRPVGERYITTRFLDDLLKVERLLTDDGVTMPLNVEGNRYSVSTPQMDRLRLPRELGDRYQTEGLEVYYRARHPLLVTQAGYIDPARVEVELPYSHLQALLYFVASRVHNPIGMGQEFNAGNNWAARYEQECAFLEREGVEIDGSLEDDKLRRNGWV